MNDRRVMELAKKWARRVHRDSSLKSEESQMESMILAAYRESLILVKSNCFNYLNESKKRYLAIGQERASLAEAIKVKHQAIAALLQPTRDKLLASRGKEPVVNQEACPCRLHGGCLTKI